MNDINLIKCRKVISSILFYLPPVPLKSCCTASIGIKNSDEGIADSGSYISSEPNDFISKSVINLEQASCFPNPDIIPFSG